MAILGFASVFQSMRATVAPADGPFELMDAFEAVIIGGMGSIWGASRRDGAGISESIGFRINLGFAISGGASGLPGGAGARLQGIMGRD